MQLLPPSDSEYENVVSFYLEPEQRTGNLELDLRECIRKAWQLRFDNSVYGGKAIDGLRKKFKWSWGRLQRETAFGDRAGIPPTTAMRWSTSPLDSKET